MADRQYAILMTYDDGKRYVTFVKSRKDATRQFAWGWRDEPYVVSAALYPAQNHIEDTSRPPLRTWQRHRKEGN